MYFRQYLFLCVSLFPCFCVLNAGGTDINHERFQSGCFRNTAVVRTPRLQDTGLQHHSHIVPLGSVNRTACSFFGGWGGVFTEVTLFRKSDSV
jgi:hypothetical protein